MGFDGKHGVLVDVVTTDAPKITANAKPTAAVIGAGPAGLMAAQRLAEAGCAVTIFERKAAPARKFLMAGRGGLNLTHTTAAEAALAKYGETAQHLSAALEKFTPDDMRAWAHGLSQGTFVGTSGRVFPKTLKASPLLRAWLRHLGYFDVSLLLKHRWTGWDDAGRLTFTTEDAYSHEQTSNTFVADVTVLAMGGASWPNLGSDGRWTDILQACGVGIVPFAPSNTALCIPWSDQLKSKFAGRPVKNIAITSGETRAVGEAVITSQGLEGGVCYALNPVLRNELRSAPVATLHVDLKPDMSEGMIAERLARPRGSQAQTNHVRKATGLSAPAIALLREPGRGALPHEALELAALIKSLPLKCTALSGLDRAISSAGGVSFSAIGPDYMLKDRPGVFVAGEMLDWEAPTGGYLLQATFATAIAAADAALNRVKATLTTA